MSTNQSTYLKLAYIIENFRSSLKSSNISKITLLLPLLSRLDSISAIDPELKQEMYGNIVLCGGSTMFEGMRDRITKDLLGVSGGCEVKVLAPPNRKNATFVGGKLVAQLDNFDKYCIGREEYMEFGPDIMFWKLIH